jgi:hypothetical protein
MGQKAAVLSLPDQIRGLRPPFHPFHTDLIMESPYLGWIVPYEWQEPGDDDDITPETAEQWDECDGDSDFTL